MDPRRGDTSPNYYNEINDRNWARDDFIFFSYANVNNIAGDQEVLSFTTSPGRDGAIFGFRITFTNGLIPVTPAAAWNMRIFFNNKYIPYSGGGANLFDYVIYQGQDVEYFFPFFGTNTNQFRIVISNTTGVNYVMAVRVAGTYMKKQYDDRY